MRWVTTSVTTPSTRIGMPSAVTAISSRPGCKTTYSTMERLEMSDFNSSEMMSVTAARALNNDMTCFVGIGLPSEAANLARLTHAPDITLIDESGTLQAKPDVLPLSIRDGELWCAALTTGSVPEMVRYWQQRVYASDATRS